MKKKHNRCDELTTYLRNCSSNINIFLQFIESLSEYNKGKTKTYTSNGKSYAQITNQNNQYEYEINRS